MKAGLVILFACVCETISVSAMENVVGGTAGHGNCGMKQQYFSISL